jgi:hypothetical protein
MYQIVLLNSEKNSCTKAVGSHEEDWNVWKGEGSGKKDEPPLPLTLNPVFP